MAASQDTGYRSWLAALVFNSEAISAVHAYIGYKRSWSPPYAEHSLCGLLYVFIWFHCQGKI